MSGKSLYPVKLTGTWVTEIEIAENTGLQNELFDRVTRGVDDDTAKTLKLIYEKTYCPNTP